MACCETSFSHFHFQCVCVCVTSHAVLRRLMSPGLIGSPQLVDDVSAACTSMLLSD